MKILRTEELIVGCTICYVPMDDQDKPRKAAKSEKSLIEKVRSGKHGYM